MRSLLVTAAALGFAIAHSQAGSEVPNKTITQVETPFDDGKWELQWTSGAYFSVGSSDRPTLNYATTALRLGVMLNSPSGDGCFRGNCELLLQAFGGVVFDGPGDGLGGAALLLRYNFVQPDSKWAPYVQLGAGTVYNDIYKDHSQRLIGQEWEWDLEAAVGVRYFFSDRCSAHLEGGFRHVSNADANERNIGLNSVGATIGLSLHF